MTNNPITRPDRHTKAIILSAGQGRRLLPLTESTPKCLSYCVLDNNLEQGLRTFLKQVRDVRRAAP